MHRVPSGYQHYHDEYSQQAYGTPYTPNIYANHPAISQDFAQGSSYFYPPQPQPTPAIYTAQPMAASMSRDHPSMRQAPQLVPAFTADPAFSADPRANPYTHLTTFAMDSREEIVPAGPGHDVSSRLSFSKLSRTLSPQSFYLPHQAHASPYHPADSRSRRDISSIYGPPVVPDRYSSNRPVSDGSHYALFSYAAQPARDRHASAASIRLPYDAPDPHAHPPVIPVPPPVTHSSSNMSKLHRPKHKHSASLPQDPRNRSVGLAYAESAAPSFSSSSSGTSSFVHVPTNNTSRSSVSLATSSKSRSNLHVGSIPDGASSSPHAAPPRRAPDSPYSTSSGSSAEEPITPQTTPEKMSVSSSKSSKHAKYSPKNVPAPLSLDALKVKDILNASAAEDSPPAYTPLPGQTEAATAALNFANNVDTNSPLAPERVGVDPTNTPSTFQHPSPPERHSPLTRHSPPHEAAVPLAFPATSQTPSSSHPSLQPPSEIKKSRSRKTSIAAAPKELDKIDELDETDPLGFAWHHHGPYEAIQKAAKLAGQQDGAGVKESPGAKIFVSYSGQYIALMTNVDLRRRVPMALTRVWEAKTLRRYVLVYRYSYI